MSEEFNIQTEKLQRFIDGEICLDELSIDKDVLEGIFVLRPELSPKPKVLIDKVWSDYQSKVETRDLYEIESMLILDPHLPLPNVKIEDILSSLENGPLIKDSSIDKDIFDRNTTKQKETFGVVASDKDSQSENVIEFAAANKKAEQLQNNRWQLWGGILVAASVLFIMVPSTILNSHESSISSPTFSQNSETIESNDVRVNNPKEKLKPKSSFEQEAFLDQNASIPAQQPKRSSKQKYKKTKSRKKKNIPNISTEAPPAKLDSRSSNEVVPEKKQIDLDEEIPLVPANIIREETSSEAILAKEVDLKSPSVANESVDALSDNYEQDIGDVYEERSTQIEYIEDSIEEIDIVTRQEKRSLKRSRNDFGSKRRVKNSPRTFAENAPAPTNITVEDRVAESERITEDILNEQSMASNVLIKIQIYDSSGSLHMSSTDIRFQYGTQEVIPYKTTDGFWVFSMPEITIGKLIVGNIQSEAFLAKDQHVCRMVDQKLMCE